MPSRRKLTSRKNKTTQALAKVIRLHRHAMGVSQEAFAEKVSLSKNYIGNLERGEYEPSVTTLTVVAHQFGLKASDLLLEAGL